MPEAAAPATTADTATTTGAPTTSSITIETAETPAPDTGTDLAAEVEKWKALAQKHEARAKGNATAAKELEDLKRSSMSETEKAIDEAKATARADALAEFGGRLVDAEIKVKASGRLAPEQLDTLLSAVDRRTFLGDDGTVNADAVAQWIDGIAPAQTGRPGVPDLGQGPRGNNGNLPLNGDPLEKSLRTALGMPS